MLVLFDGYCNLCSGSVQFIHKRDSMRRFRFAPLNGPTAERILRKNFSGPPPDSIVLIEGGKVYTCSTAALRIAKKLDGAWPLLYACIILPVPLRDMVYRFISRKRYGWFGKRETCWLPQPGWEAWFPDLQEKGIDKTTPASS